MTTTDRCPTPGCRRTAQPGDYLCALCRARRSLDTRPAVLNPTWCGDRSYEDRDEKRRMREGA